MCCTSGQNFSMLSAINYISMYIFCNITFYSYIKCKFNLSIINTFNDKNTINTIILQNSGIKGTTFHFLLKSINNAIFYR